MTTRWNGNVEIATFHEQGRDFTHFGAMIGKDIVAGYVKCHEPTGRYYLSSWGGDFMYLELFPRGKYKARGAWVFSWTTLIDGKRFSGRNSGTEMRVQLRRTTR